MQEMPLFETSIWIVHREPGPRTALARMAGDVRGRHEMLLGTPFDSIFESAAPPHVVILDVSSAALDPEPELEFARRVSGQHRACRWILLVEPVARAAAGQLFDALDARTLRYPPDARSLQAALAAALDGLRPLPLSRRIGRDSLAARFARWFGSNEPALLSLALEPRFAAEPLLVHGERGTGRGLLLRYAHSVSSPEGAFFVRVACAETTQPEQLLAQIEAGVHEAGSETQRAGARLGLWLEEVDRLNESAQVRVLDWIEFGLPSALPASTRRDVRWLASAGIEPQALDPRLALAFSELTLWTQPLRNHPHAIAAFVGDTARAWAVSRRQAPKPFDPPALDRLRDEPWPGNLAELEALVTRCLAHAAPEAETIRVKDLRLESGFEPEATPEAPEPLPEATPEAPEPLPEATPEAPEPLPEATPEASEPLPEATPEASEPHQRAPEAIPELPPDAPDPLESLPSNSNPVAQLAATVAHEVRNPLVSIRTFSELLDEHYADAEFRSRFGRLVGEDVRRIEEVVERLEQLGELGVSTIAADEEQIDVTGMLEELIEGQRTNIQTKRLLVLKELDREYPHSFGTETALRPALGGVLAQAIEEIPVRGDLYLASSHHTALEGRASMRVLFRYRVETRFTADQDELVASGSQETRLDHAQAERVIRQQGGSLTIDTTQAEETLIVIDLPAPPSN